MWRHPHDHPAVLVADYLATLEDDGISDPLGAELRVAAVLADLFTISGEPVPSAIEAALDRETVDWCGTQPPY